MGDEAMNICPVCGYAGLEEPSHDSFGYGSQDICPSCGTQFGYHDATTPHEVLRKSWIEGGCIWWSQSDERPNDWNPEFQLSRVG